jgi:hypothetical protein
MREAIQGHREGDLRTMPTACDNLSPDTQDTGQRILYPSQVRVAFGLLQCMQTWTYGIVNIGD